MIAALRNIGLPELLIIGALVTLFFGPGLIRRFVSTWKETKAALREAQSE